MLTRNRLPFTRKCLESLAGTPEIAEWIVVDNGSEDGTRDYLDRLRRQPGTAVEVILNGGDPGGCCSRNLGIARAGAEYLLFLDNDVYLDRDGWLGELLAPLREDPALVAASPLLLFPGEEGLVQSAGGGVTATGRFGLLGRGAPPDPASREPREQAWAPTAALLVRRRPLLEAGGFDPTFDPLSIGEDVDLCCRLRAAGGRIAFVPEARLRHFEGTTFNHVSYEKRPYWLRHARAIRERWLDVMRAGPLHAEEEIAWRPLLKSYDDLEAATVRPATVAEQGVEDLSFFASSPTLPARPLDLRIGVIGCGQVAVKGALPGFSPLRSAAADEAAPFLDFGGADGVRLVGIADTDLPRAEEAARRFGALRAEADGETLLATVPMEGVAICTPPAWQSGYAIAALRRDVSVLLEKPGAVSEVELEALLEERRRHPDPACVINLPWQYRREVEAAREAIAAVGAESFTLARCVFEHGGPEAWSPEASWYRRGPGCGPVLDLGTHALALLERLLGGDVSDLRPDAVEGNAGERAAATARSGTTEIEVEVGWDAAQPRFSVELEGDREPLVVDLLSAGSAPPRRDPFAGGPYRHFLDCARGGGTAMTDLTRVANPLRQALRWNEAAAVLREAERGKLADAERS